MRSPFRHLLRTTLLVLATCFIPAQASGQVVTTSFGPFTVTCTSTGELCNNVFSVSVATISTLQVQYVASSGHCSNVAAHILVDGVERAVTALLPPGSASQNFDVGPVSAGSHVVALRGEGAVGGCNTGTLANWGGTMNVVHDAAFSATAAPVPTLSLPLLAVLSAVLLVVAGWATRRRQR